MSNEENQFGIDVFQPVVQEYRVALFDGLGRRYGKRIAIQASAERKGGDVSLPLHDMTYDYDHQYVKIGPFVWQKGFRFVKAKKKGDVVVICGDVHQLSSLWLAIKAKCKGFKVVWWGHHRSATSKDLGVAIRLLIARFLSHVFLTYTQDGVDYLLKHGFKSGRVFATGNTIDLSKITEQIPRWTTEKLAEFRACEGVQGKHILLFSSALRSKVKLDLLFDALSRMPDLLSSTLVVVVGDGAMKDFYQTRVRELGLEKNVRWLGKVLDQSVLAPWFLSADYFVYPGSIGLSIIHAFAYGLPVITHGNKEHQMPEFAVMRPNETGFCFEEDSSEDLERALRHAFSLPEDERRKMGAFVQRLVQENYSMDKMVASFAKAVERSRYL